MLLNVTSAVQPCKTQSKIMFITLITQRIFLKVPLDFYKPPGGSIERISFTLPLVSFSFCFHHSVLCSLGEHIGRALIKSNPIVALPLRPEHKQCRKQDKQDSHPFHPQTRHIIPVQELFPLFNACLRVCLNMCTCVFFGSDRIPASGRFSKAAL